MKLRKLHIEDYKMFKDFDISFVDKDDKPLDIIVLAGVNGSGKTSLLEYVYKTFEYDFTKLNGRILLDTSDLEDSFLPHHFEIEGHSSKTLLSKYEPDIALEKASLLFHNISYIPVGKDNIDNIKETIRQKYIDRAFEIDKPSEALKELQNYIAKIFDGLNLTFNLASINYNKKEVLFKDNNGVEFDIDALSTGEKTLLSKVLYLYFEGYENKIILIDEPELSLHPSWQNKVLKIYENFALKNSCQIIIATHSPHIIASAKNEYLRFLIKEDNKIVVKQLSGSPLDRDINTIVKTIMGANYLPLELEELRRQYRELFDKELEDTPEAKELEKKILDWESPNSSFWQGIAFDKELRSI